MQKHILEKLAATNPECEIWWDSSPLLYDDWKTSIVKAAEPDKRMSWNAQLTRLFDRDALKNDGRMGFRGVTTNPPLSLQAIQGNPEYWSENILAQAAKTPDATVEQIYWQIYLNIVRLGAEMILPAYEASGGKYGFLSGQVDPRLVLDESAMLAQGLEISKLALNVMVKIPGSSQGYNVIEELTALGISTNNTTAFTVSQYVACMNAVSRGLERAKAANIDLSRWRSVITHMSARLGNAGDLKAQAEVRGIDLTPEDILYGELAVLKRAYWHGKEIGHPSKMLQCSMRVTDKNADGSASSWHIEKLAGGDLVYTCPPSYISQLMKIEDRMTPFDATSINEAAPPATMEKLLKIPYFRQAYEFDGMQPEEFSGFAAFVTTAAEFAAATRKTVDFVAHVLEGAREYAS